MKKNITLLFTLLFGLVVGNQTVFAAPISLGLNSNSVIENNLINKKIGNLSYTTNDGPIPFTLSNITGDTSSGRKAVAGDVDGDGDIDIYVTNSSNQQNQLWINDGLGNGGASFTKKNITGDLGVSLGAAIGDVDNDGDLDIYVANFSNQQNRLWINDGLGNFTSSSISGDTGNSKGTTFFDVDNDGDLDIYTVNGGGNFANRLWINDGLGNGGASFTAKDIVADFGDSYAVTGGDVDGDGDLDIYITNYGQNRLWINDGSNNFTNNDIFGDGGTSQSAIIIDIDRDEDLDIYVSNNGQQNRLWINDGLGNFTSNDIPNDVGASIGGDIADIDNDGDLDIYIANSNAQQNRLWINDGLLNFSDNSISGDVGNSSVGLFVDVDNDGDFEIYVSGNGQNRLWINNSIQYTLSFSCIVSGSDDSKFSIDPKTNKLFINEVADFETQNTYSICVRVTDGTNHYDKNLTINVTDVFEANPSVAVQNTTTPVSIITGTADVLATALEVTVNDVTYVLGADAELTFNSGVWKLSLINPLLLGKYEVSVSSSDGTNILLDLTTYEINIEKESSKSSKRTYTCKDPKASNYSQFGAHKLSLCEYNNIIKPIVDIVEIPQTPDTTEKNVTGLEELLKNKTCLYFNQHMKTGDRDGRYSQTKQRIGVSNLVSEISFLQKTLNILGYDSGTADGIYGNKTKSAVSQFQMAHFNTILKPWGLTKPTGFYYQSTNVQLNKVLGCKDMTTLDNGVFVD